MSTASELLRHGRALLHAAHNDRATWQSCFELAETSELAIADAAFALGDALAAVTPRLPPDALDAAARAADHLGRRDRARRYRAMLGRPTTTDKRSLLVL